MAEILVKVPLTTNGSNPLIINGQAQYKDVIVPVAGKANLEKVNKTLPDHLKMTFHDYNGEEITEEVKEVFPAPKQKAK